MGLEDFDKIQNKDSVVEDKRIVNKKMINDEVELGEIHYYVYHMDELFECVSKSYFDYVNAKLKYDFMKDKLQTTTDWSIENTLRADNNLPKVTTQTQRDSVIDLKLKNLKVSMESCEMKYKIYSKILSFISKNFELVIEYYSNCEIEDISDK